MQQALDLANGNGIRIAVSNPCFELWLVLHERDQRAWISRGDVRSLARSLFNVRKSLGNDLADRLIDRLDDAVARAKSLAERHQHGCGEPSENPSSGMWELMQSLQS